MLEMPLVRQLKAGETITNPQYKTVSVSMLINHADEEIKFSLIHRGNPVQLVLPPSGEMRLLGVYKPKVTSSPYFIELVSLKMVSLENRKYVAHATAHGEI